MPREDCAAPVYAPDGVVSVYLTNCGKDRADHRSVADSTP